MKQPRSFREFTVEEWRDWIMTAIQGEPLSPRIPLGRDVQIHHALRDLYATLGSERVRRNMISGLSLAITGTPILPEDGRILAQLSYLFRLASDLKPAPARHFLRSLLKSEVLVGTSVAGADLHCLLVGVCGESGVERGFIGDLHAALPRIRGPEYPLACFLTLALGCDSANEACRFLPHILPLLEDAAVVSKVMDCVEFCASMHRWEVLSDWYLAHEEQLGEELPRQLRLFEAGLAALLNRMPVGDLVDAEQLLTRFFTKFGPKSLIDFVTGHADDPRGCVALLGRLYEMGLVWCMYDPAALDLWDRAFHPNTPQTVSIGSRRVPLDIEVKQREYWILAEAMTYRVMTSPTLKLSRMVEGGTTIQ